MRSNTKMEWITNFILYLYNKDLSMKLGRLRRGKFFYPFRKDHIFPLPSAPSKNDT